jgi:two-component system chemotaxis sensor kinase CheA
VKLTDYLWLPAEMTDFEHAYVSRMNKVGLGFFWANLPVFAIVAYFNDTGPVFAMALTLLVLAGPTVALLTLANPRTVSLFIGFAAMCMGGLLVHFGQGPLQIEMHFYFFSLLAVLAMYANPTVILVAAVTVTLHHTVIYLLIPTSVFNYEASIWVVAVHAAFVVVESVAACFISRSFFDNVIGLDKIVQARTAALDARNQDMRLVLDHVNQGLVTLDAEGRVSRERSARIDEWLASPEAGIGFGDAIAKVDPIAGEWFELGWEEVVDGFLPLDLALDQLPGSLSVGDRHLRLSYQPIFAARGDERPNKVLVVVTDVTADVAREAAEQDQRETMRIFERFLADKSGFLEFFDESRHLIEGLADATYGSDLAACKRMLHTLKGNALIFGLDSVGAYVHELESAIIEESRDLTDLERDALRARWARLSGTLDRLIGGHQGPGVELDDGEYEAIVAAVRAGRSSEELLTIIRNWKLEPASRRLQRLAEQARGIADRLGMDQVRIVIEDNDVRLEPERFGSFWQSFVHVLRNALDHGLEPADERASAGKDRVGSLDLRTELQGDHLVIELGDDGRGIDWDQVRDKALAAGLDVSTDRALERALFHDGITTRAVATSVSGRGVGMGAVLEACTRLGGEIELQSEPGKGTRLRFRFPTDAAQVSQRAAA